MPRSRAPKYWASLLDVTATWQVCGAIVLIGLGWLILKARQNLVSAYQYGQPDRTGFDRHPGLPDRRLLHPGRTMPAGQWSHRAGVSRHLKAPKEQTLPDIYLIILDKYARDDVLAEQFDYDNSAFLAELEARGFYIARCSQSNYSYTGVAMSSELNLDYLQEMRPDYFVPENSADRTLLSQMVRHSVVRESLEQLGYITVDISSHEPIQIKDADVFIDPNDRLVTNASADLFVNPFEAMFIRTTALAFPLDMDIARNRQVANAVNYPFLKHLRAQQYVLASAERIISQRSPKFVLLPYRRPPPAFRLRTQRRDLHTPGGCAWV